MPDPVEHKKPVAYFQRKPEELPLHRLRLLVSQWVLPFNNLVLLFGTLGINVVVAGVADFLSPYIHVFPWLTAGSLALALATALIQMEIIPTFGGAARTSWLARILYWPPMVGIWFTLALLAYSGSIYAAAHPDGRGILSKEFPAIGTLQDQLLHISEGIRQLQGDVSHTRSTLDQMATVQSAAMAEAAARKRAAALMPASLALINLEKSLTAGSSSQTPLVLSIMKGSQSPRLSAGELHMHISGGMAPASDRDLTPALSRSVLQEVLHLSVPADAREITICFTAPYPSATDRHTLVARYTLARDANGTRVEPRDEQALVDAGAIADRCLN